MSKRYLSLSLFLLACGQREAQPPPPATGSGPEAKPAGAPPAEPPPPAATKSVTLTGLGLTMTVPGCAIVKADDESRAMIQPDAPECRDLTLMGIEIRDAAKDFKPDAESVQKYLGGKDVTETKLADGIRLDYAATRTKGVVINRQIGSTNINCRGAGDEAQLRAIEAACMSLAAK